MFKGLKLQTGWRRRCVGEKGCCYEGPSKEFEKGNGLICPQCGKNNLFYVIPPKARLHASAINLYIGAHGDDIEIGCAGTICKNREHEQHLAIFSTCGKNNILGFTDEDLIAEIFKSAEVLKIPRDRVNIYDFELTEFPRDHNKIRSVIEQLADDIDPDVIYTHSPRDRHQDHSVLAMETVRAFRRGGEIRFMESPYCRPFNPNLYINITDTIDEKIEALNCYETQHIRPDWSEHGWLSMAGFRGLQAGVKYAEAFEIYVRLE